MKKCAESGLRAASGPAAGAGAGAGRARRRGRGTARASGRPDHPLAAPRPRGLPSAAARPRRALPPPRGSGQRRDSELWELRQRLPKRCPHRPSCPCPPGRSPCAGPAWAMYRHGQAELGVCTRPCWGSLGTASSFKRKQTENHHPEKQIQKPPNEGREFKIKRIILNQPKPFNLASIDGSTEDEPQEDETSCPHIHAQALPCLLWLLYITYVSSWITQSPGSFIYMRRLFREQFTPKS